MWKDVEKHIVDLTGAWEEAPLFLAHEKTAKFRTKHAEISF